MNIFYLSHDPRQAAAYHHDRHMKMILESAQMLSTVCHLRGVADSTVYRPTHQNHPCVKWLVKPHWANLDWLYELAVELGAEYTRRSDHGKAHRSMAVCHAARRALGPCRATAISPPAQTMPEQYQSACALHSYRTFYAAEKMKMGYPMGTRSRWTGSEPWWLSSHERAAGRNNDKRGSV